MGSPVKPEKLPWYLDTERFKPIVEAFANSIANMGIRAFYGREGQGTFAPLIEGVSGLDKEELMERARAGGPDLYSAAAGSTPIGYIPQTIADIATYSAMSGEKPTLPMIALAALPGMMPHGIIPRGAKGNEVIRELLSDVGTLKYKMQELTTANPDWLNLKDVYDKEYSDLYARVKKYFSEELHLSAEEASATASQFMQASPISKNRTTFTQEELDEVWTTVTKQYPELWQPNLTYDDVRYKPEGVSWADQADAAAKRFAREQPDQYGLGTWREVAPDVAMANRKKWFGNSVVRTAEGNPEIVYHTARRGEIFSSFGVTSDVGFHFGTPITAFTISPPSPTKGAFHIKLENPVFTPDLGGWAGDELAEHAATYMAYVEARKAFGYPHIPGASPKQLQQDIHARLKNKGWLDGRIVDRVMAVEQEARNIRYRLLDKWRDKVKYYKANPDEAIEKLKDLFGETDSSLRYHSPEKRVERIHQLVSRELIEEQGYDGIKYYNTVEHPLASTPNGSVFTTTKPEHLSYIVFNKNQIKSATSNIGTFDPDADEFLRAFLPLIPAAGAGSLLLRNANAAEREAKEKG